MCCIRPETLSYNFSCRSHPPFNPSLTLSTSQVQ
jgi:hypothetical protein